LWIDAICINQSDINEKTVQFPLPKVTYAPATRVAIWLGEEDETSSTTFSAIEKWAEWHATLGVKRRRVGMKP